jgi:23S rRNA (guanosine2251-2'-O)-methyltransferase
MREISLIVHDIRSCHNVGSLLRTADGMGVKTVFLTGYTPYPIPPNDTRLPHIAAKVERRIHKTALGAESSVNWKYIQDIQKVFELLKEDEFELVAIEQSKKAKPIADIDFPNKVALIVGNEVDGIDESTLLLVNKVAEIPMFGKKESYNVAQATAMALYHLRFFA